MLVPEQVKNMFSKEQVVQKIQEMRRGLRIPNLIFLKIVWAPMPRRSSHDVLYVILNAQDGQQKNALTRAWQKNKLADSKRQVITAALAAGVISSAFSWYVIEETSWKTKATWYSSLILALTSISTAGLHIATLLRLSCTVDWEPNFHAALSRPVDGLTSSERRPRSLQLWIWQTPGLMLKLSQFLFIAGLAIMIWEKAMTAGLNIRSDELKIAIFFSVVGAFSLTNYGLSVFCLLVPTLDLK